MTKQKKTVGTSIMWFCIIMGVATVVAVIFYFIGREKKKHD